jgi:superoxide reductase
MSHTPYIKQPSEEGKEKHVPTIKVDGDSVHVIVGDETPHPNTVEHHIVWAELYGEKKDGGQVVDLGRVQFTPVHTDPRATFKVNNIGDFAKFHAMEYCNIHGVWTNTLER